MTEQVTIITSEQLNRWDLGIAWASVHGLGDPVFIKPGSKPASKPADPAFKNALRQRPMRIGLRYIGD
jgi:hypothetical protein